MLYTDLPFPEGVTLIEYPDREAWLAARYEKPWRIGASEVSALFGEHTYLSPFALAQSKMGNKLDAKDANLARRGHLYEQAIAEDAVHTLNDEAVEGIRYEIVWLPKWCGVVNEKYPSLAATPDAMIVCWQDFGVRVNNGTEEGDTEHANRMLWFGPVEVKRVHWQKRDEWEGEPPIAYQVQNQVQMLCCGCTKGVLSGMISDDLSVTLTEIYDPLCSTIVEATTTFLGNLTLGILPPVDAHESTTRALGKFYRAKGDTPIQLPADAEMWALELESAKEDKKAAEVRVDFYANQIKAALGENTVGQYLGGKFTWKEQGGNATKVEVDLKYLDVMKDSGIPHAVKTSPVSRVLRHTKAKQ